MSDANTLGTGGVEKPSPSDPRKTVPHSKTFSSKNDPSILSEISQKLDEFNKIKVKAENLHKKIFQQSQMGVVRDQKDIDHYEDLRKDLKAIAIEINALSKKRGDRYPITFPDCGIV